MNKKSVKKSVKAKKKPVAIEPEVILEPEVVKEVIVPQVVAQPEEQFILRGNLKFRRVTTFHANGDKTTNLELVK